MLRYLENAAGSETETGEAGDVRDQQIPVSPLRLEGHVQEDVDLRTPHSRHVGVAVSAQNLVDEALDVLGASLGDSKELFGALRGGRSGDDDGDGAPLPMTRWLTSFGDAVTVRARRG